MNSNPLTKNQYFGTLPASKLAGELIERVIRFDDYLRTSGRLRLWSRSYTFYNRGIYKDGRINLAGEQGEYSEIYVNHFRNLLTHILNMTTSQRPTFDARSANTDFKSQAQTIVANNIIDYYNRSKGLEVFTKNAVEDVLQFADGYIYQGWDFSLGDPFTKDQRTGRIIKQGDVLHKNFTPLDVIFDHTGGVRDAVRQWYIVRDFQNKWDLAKLYPEMKDKILKYASDTTMANHSRVGPGGDADSDFIPVFIFMHDRTESLPDGRFYTFVGKDCWLIDSALPSFYKKLPLKRLCGSEQRGSGFGYTTAFDLLPLQEACDGLYSTILTNQATFGVQNITMPSGSNIDVQQLADGLNLINYDPKLGKPEALKLLSTPSEIFEFLNKFEEVMETISGINSVARGNPEASLKSGSALALVQSMAIQFISGLQQSYINLLEELGTGLINILKENANTPRMIEIVGESNKSYLKEFTKKDISSINRVTVDIGNPLSRTTAGKVSMADNLLAAKMIENADQYIQVLTTGRLEPVIENKQAELMLVRSENELMSNGGRAIATAIDNHPLHVLEHKAVIASTEARKDPAVVQAVLDHIQEHLDLWKQSDPSMLQMLGQPAPPPMLPAPPGPPNGSTSSPAAQLEAGNPTEGAAAKVRLPNLPKNPLSQVPAGIGG